jgi:hypothetical protein
MKMLLEYLEKFTKASRAEFGQLLMKKISDAPDSSQKKNFITNLLQEMRREGIIDGTSIYVEGACARSGDSAYRSNQV